MSKQNFDVCVIGGGIIGLCCAYYLQKEGKSVIVLDKGPIEKASSHGNCGYISPSHIVPLNDWSLILKSLKEEGIEILYYNYIGSLFTIYTDFSRKDYVYKIMNTIMLDMGFKDTQISNELCQISFIGYLLSNNKGIINKKIEEILKDHKINIIDTPGHAAFSHMRQRGTDITDIIIFFSLIMPSRPYSCCKVGGVRDATTAL